MSSARPSAVFRALSFRLTAGFAILLVASLALLYSLGSWQMERALIERDRSAILDEIQELERAFAEDGADGVLEETMESAEELDRRRFYVRLATADGQTRVAAPVDEWPADALAYLEAQVRPAAGSWIRVAFGDDRALDLLTHQTQDGGILQVGATTENRQEVLDAFRRTLWLSVIPVIVLSLLGGMALARRILLPVRELAATTRQIASTGDLGRRVALRGSGDELDALANQFNAMLDRIASLLHGLRDTLDYIAHDLRTPMTRMRGRIELALGTSQPASPLAETLADTLEDTEQIVTILNAIMEEAEAEAGTLPLHRESVSLQALVDDVLDLYQYPAEERALTFDVIADGDVRIQADKSRMRRAIANLVDNAVKYTPAGGRIEVRFSGDGDGVRLRVYNSGDGIAEGDLPRIWDRLYRGDRSRSTRGLGLGLSLVKAIVEAHGGRVAVANAEAGVAFTIQVPNAGPHSR